MNRHIRPDTPFFHQSQLASQNGIYHQIFGLYHRIHLIQIFIQPSQIGDQLLIFSKLSIGLHGLDMIMVIMPPAPHGAIHVFHLVVVPVHEVALKVLQLPVHQTGHPEQKKDRVRGRKKRKSSNDPSCHNSSVHLSLFRK